MGDRLGIPGDVGFSFSIYAVIYFQYNILMYYTLFDQLFCQVICQMVTHTHRAYYNTREEEDEWLE